MGESVARVALAIPVQNLFDYRIPASLEEKVQPGSRLRVPFGRGLRIGYCVERAEESEFPNLKEIEAVIDDQPLVSSDLMRLVRWTSDYYVAPLGEVIESAVPKPVREGKLKSIKWVRAIDLEAPSGKGAGKEARERIIERLATSDQPVTLRRLKKECSVSDSPVHTLQRRGVLELFKAPPPEFGIPGHVVPDGEEPWRRPSPHQLQRQQEKAIDAIATTLEPTSYRTFLLHGVTGSGKTEVYIQCVSKALERGRGALVLLPEISLTPQVVERFTERLGPVAVLHSLLPPSERSLHYQRLRSGEVKVAIGARSAIFAPVPDLGIIIVDESHESSYKQENTPRYHARDLAVVRASQAGIPCVLGSATPSLESLENACNGRYQLLSLPERVSGRSLATIEIVDRRNDRSMALLSERLVQEIGRTIDRGEQVLLFLNRRGFSRNIHCPQCGFVLRCGDCDIGLTYHKISDRSLCHYCGSVHPLPRECPDCSFTGIRQQRPGTERLEETLYSLFRGTTIDRLDRDTATSSSRMEKILRKFREGETRILIGTQMIAKGHDIPGVTLVGVIDADLALSVPDFRAAERTAQLLCQVSGRAGRGDLPGRVLIQTRQPEHYAIAAAMEQDLEGLREQEESTRRLLSYPPYGYLARVLIEDPDEERTLESASRIREQLLGGSDKGAKILGPAPAPIARLRGKFRQHILIKSTDRRAIHSVIQRIAGERPRWSTSRITIDIDPQNIV